MAEVNRKWKPISGYENYYEVSDDGLVRSLNYRNTKNPSLLKTPPHKKIQGYLRCVLRNDKEKNKPFLVHRLVAVAFLDPPDDESKTTVNHKNGNRLDNRVENLEWSSYKEQVHHADRVLGKNNRAYKSGKSKLTREQVLEVLRRVSSGERQQDIAKSLSVSSMCIHGIITGKRWSSFTGIEPHAIGKAGNSKLSREDVESMKKQRNEGASLQQIASEFNVSSATVSRAVRGKTWA